MAQATIEQMVDEAVKAAVQRAVAQCYEKAEKELLPKAVSQATGNIFPVGSYWITEGTQNPGNIFGGTWKKKGQGRCLWGADDAHLAGSEIEAGLPNITGQFGCDDRAAGYRNGAFGIGSQSGVNTSAEGGDGRPWYYFDFNASRSSAIYGKSSTVQPPALVVNIWVRIS